jgi:CheY-like chemotaxis protein
VPFFGYGLTREVAMARSDREFRHVVLIEDDPDIREIARIALADIGRLTVDLYGSASAALAAIPALDPDLILLDMVMPEMDGAETFHALRRQPGLSDTPVVFLTARVQGPEVDSYLALGASAVLSKPFDPLTLADECRGVWEGARRAANPA